MITKVEGRKHFCNFCDKQQVFTDFGLAFTPDGMRKRKSNCCSQCGSLERHRSLIFYLREKNNLLNKKLSLLHFAPEHCLHAFFKSLKNIRYVTADLYNPAQLKLDVRNINLPENSFDAIICYHVLEHIIQDHQAMQELFRVLKPGGWAILQVPLWRDRPDTFDDPNISTPEDRLKHYGQHDHVRMYGWKDYKQRLERAGFVVKGRGLA